MKITIPGIGEFDALQVAGAVLGVITTLSAIIGIAVSATQPAPPRETTCNWASDAVPVIDGTSVTLLADSPATVKLTGLTAGDAQLDRSECPSSYTSTGEGNPSLTITAPTDSRLYLHVGYDDSNTVDGRTKAPYTVTVSRPGEEDTVSELANVYGGQFWTLGLTAGEPTTITVHPTTGKEPVYPGLIIGSPILGPAPVAQEDGDSSSSSSTDSADNGSSEK